MTACKGLIIELDGLCLRECYSFRGLLFDYWLRFDFVFNGRDDSDIVIVLYLEHLRRCIQVSRPPDNEIIIIGLLILGEGIQLRVKKVRYEDFIDLFPHWGEIVIRCRHLLVVVHLVNLVEKLGRDQVLQKN
jgi:hypothetical protein